MHGSLTANESGNGAFVSNQAFSTRTGTRRRGTPRWGSTAFRHARNTHTQSCIVTAPSAPFQMPRRAPLSPVLRPSTSAACLATRLAVVSQLGSPCAGLALSSVASVVAVALLFSFSFSFSLSVSVRASVTDKTLGHVSALKLELELKPMSSSRLDK